MRLILVRHAQPLIANGVCYGRLDVDADMDASELAALSVQRFLNASGQFASHICCSAMRRTQVLAQALASYFPDAEVRQDARLNEMNFGCWEGIAWDHIPRSALDAWTNNFGAHPFGGVESCNQVIARVADAYDELLRNDLEDEADVLWVTHAGVIRALNFYLETGCREIKHVNDWPLSAPTFGEWDIKHFGRENKIR